MNRRDFIIKAGLLPCGASLVAGDLLAREKSRTKHAALGDHKIDKVEYTSAKYHFPRLVGRNARGGIHGQHKKVNCVKVFTDQGAMGWGMAKGKIKNDALQNTVIGKSVDELIVSERGIMDGVHVSLDFALHDLAGIILNKPVFELLGADGPQATDVYSGMIYFDELDAEGVPAGLDRVMKNCQWDYDYGYRQLKVKIGRSGKWYPHDEGLKTDIKVVKMIHEEFGEKGVAILVDANDMYSLRDTIDFLKGVKGVPLFWIEEPFPDDLDKARELKKWMQANGFENTYYSDGEAKPDLDLLKKMARDGSLDVHLIDIAGYGFTQWRKLMPSLIESNTLTSPHAWGNMLKTNYISHISAGLGNVVTIEGVTCISDEIDFGDYKISGGKLNVSSKPGFGMRLLI